jgi:hypothetical protein
MRISPLIRIFGVKRSIFPLITLLFLAETSAFAAPEMSGQSGSATSARNDAHRLGTDNGWLTFAGGLSPWSALKADSKTVSAADLPGAGKEYAFEFRFNYPLRKPSLFSVGFCFHFFTLSNAANSSATALKSTTDITGAAVTQTQAVAANTFSSSSFGPAILITYRFPLARFFAVSERTYPYFGMGTGMYYADLTVKPLSNVADKYQAGGYGFVVRAVLGFSVELAGDVGVFLEAQYAPLVYQSAGYVLQGQMHTMFAGFNYYFDAQSSR